MSNNNVIEINNRDTITDALTDMLRTGAQQLIQQAVQVELAEFMGHYTDRLTDEGKLLWCAMVINLSVKY